MGILLNLILILIVLGVCNYKIFNIPNISIKFPIIHKLRYIIWGIYLIFSFFILLLLIFTFFTEETQSLNSENLTLIIIIIIIIISYQIKKRTNYTKKFWIPYILSMFFIIALFTPEYHPYYQFGYKPELVKEYKIVAEKRYDIPGRTRLDLRIIIPENITDTDEIISTSIEAGYKKMKEDNLDTVDILVYDRAKDVNDTYTVARINLGGWAPNDKEFELNLKTDHNKKLQKFINDKKELGQTELNKEFWEEFYNQK